MKIPKVSVIVPVYKVEEYIERCLHSLFRQTLDSIEYIFVDDASPDNSMAILDRVLERYPQRKDHVKLIRHDQNKGVAAARTSGILAATGEYMIHCDPDDYVELNMYEEMYKKAIKDNSDLVFCDYEKHWPGASKIIKLRIKPTPHEYLKQRKGINYWAPLWNVLVRSIIIKTNNILPFEGGNFAEDYGCIVRILFYSNTLSYINKPFYHYVVRLTSETNVRQAKDNFEMHKINIEGISQFLKDKNGFNDIRLYILLFFKFTYKHLYTENLEEWFYYHRECHRAIFKLNSESFKTRLIWSVVLTNKTIFKLAYKTYKRYRGRNFL